MRRIDRVATPVVVFASLLVVFVLTALFRSIDGDEGFYVFASKLVLNGSVPHKDFFYPQTFLLPYVYGSWMNLAGYTWYSARVLSAICAIAVGMLVYWHIGRTFKSRALAIVGIVLLITSGLAIGWYPVVKSYALATLLLCASYVIFERSPFPWRPFASGLLLGLAIDVRLYLVALIPAFMVASIFETRGRSRLISSAQLLAGLAVAVSPNAWLLYADPDAFFFNVLGFHALHWPGTLAATLQKMLVIMELLAMPQFLLLLCLNVYLAVRLVRASVHPPLALSIALILALVSLSPTPTYAQYFSILQPFLIINSVFLIAQVEPVPSSIHEVRIRSLLIVVPLAHALLSPLGGYGLRPATSGDWSISTVRQVSQVIGASAEHRRAVALTWWPGYLLETSATSVPGMENHFALAASRKLDPARSQRYRLASDEYVRLQIEEQRVEIVVLGNWADTIADYRELLRSHGYIVVEKIGYTEIYHRASDRSANAEINPSDILIEFER